MMKIRSLHLRDYKRFHDLTIDLGNHPARIVALVGPNGCGKSSVLDSMLYRQSAFVGVGNKGRREDDYHSLNKAKNFSFGNVSIVFDQGELETVYQQRAENQTQSTIFSFRSPYRYNSNLKITQSQTINPINENNVGASTTSDLDEKMENNYRRLQVEYQKYLHDTDSKPSEAKNHILGELNKAIGNCLDIRIESLGQIEEGKGTLFFSKKDYKNHFEYNVLSSGEKEVVDILIDLYLRADEFNDSVYLIDEPELHINTSIQRKLLFEIERLIPSNCQIWVSTHSIGFLRALQDDFSEDCQILEFQPGLEWASQTQLLTPMKKTRSNWQKIFHTALDDLTALLAPKEIIYCEGTLKRSLDEVMFNEIFSEKFSDSLFISSGGKADAERYAGIALTVLSKALVGVGIKVVLDRDNNVDIPKESSVKIVKLKRREFENYLFDYDVLLASYPTVDKKVYDSLVKSIVDDDVKAKIFDICKLCGERDDKKFRINLARNFPKNSGVYSELESIIFS